MDAFSIYFPDVANERRHYLQNCEKKRATTLSPQTPFVLTRKAFDANRGFPDFMPAKNRCHRLSRTLAPVPSLFVAMRVTQKS
jgi:hypothetical protein